MILSCLTDDVVWDLPGFEQLVGKEAFDREIENPEFTGSPRLSLDRLVEEAGTVVAIGAGAATHTSGNEMRFASCDVVTFEAGGLVTRVESYVVPFGQG
jgi:ketosteroid isomerase-like protein